MYPLLQIPGVTTDSATSLCSLSAWQWRRHWSQRGGREEYVRGGLSENWLRTAEASRRPSCTSSNIANESKAQESERIYRDLQMPTVPLMWDRSREQCEVEGDTGAVRTVNGETRQWRWCSCISLSLSSLSLSLSPARPRAINTSLSTVSPTRPAWLETHPESRHLLLVWSWLSLSLFSSLPFFCVFYFPLRCSRYFYIYGQYMSTGLYVLRIHSVQLSNST